MRNFSMVLGSDQVSSLHLITRDEDGELVPEPAPFEARLIPGGDFVIEGEEGSVSEYQELYDMGMMDFGTFAQAAFTKVLQTLMTKELITPDEAVVCFAQSFRPNTESPSPFWDLDLETHELPVLTRTVGSTVCNAGFRRTESTDIEDWLPVAAGLRATMAEKDSIARMLIAVDEDGKPEDPLTALGRLLDMFSTGANDCICGECEQSEAGQGQPGTKDVVDEVG